MKVFTVVPMTGSDRYLVFEDEVVDITLTDLRTVRVCVGYNLHRTIQELMEVDISKPDPRD